jgi:hypothetical protein
MTEDRLFEFAVQASPAERSALLDRECADNPELRARVEALLAADAQSNGTIDSPLNRPAEADADWAKAIDLSPDHEKEKVKAMQTEWKAKRKAALTASDKKEPEKN